MRCPGWSIPRYMTNESYIDQIAAGLADMGFSVVESDDTDTKHCGLETHYSLEIIYQDCQLKTTNNLNRGRMYEKALLAIIRDIGETVIKMNPLVALEIISLIASRVR